MFRKWFRRLTSGKKGPSPERDSISPVNEQREDSVGRLITEAEQTLDSEDKILLKKLSGRSISDFSWWEERTGKRAEYSLKKFLKLRLVKRPGPEDVLHFMSNEELKKLLSSYGLKKSGRKEELVNRLLNNVGLADLKNAIPKSLYKTWALTEVGKEVVKNFDKYLSAKKQEVEKEAFQLLLDGNLDRAARLVLDLRDLKMEAYGLGISNEELKKELKREAKKWLAYSYRDLDTTEELKRKAGAAIALGALFGDSMRYGAKYLQDIFPDDFPCPSLKKFADEHPEVYMVPRKKTPKNLAKVYIHYHLFRFINQDKKRQILSLIRRGIAVGIRIDVIDDCPICNTGVLYAVGGDINSIEKLPRHWGCRCGYEPILGRG